MNAVLCPLSRRSKRLIGCIFLLFLFWQFNPLGFGKVEAAGLMKRYWVCNYANTSHPQPSECQHPELGGRWVYQTDPAAQQQLNDMLAAQQQFWDQINDTIDRVWDEANDRMARDSASIQQQGDRALKGLQDTGNDVLRDLAALDAADLKAAPRSAEPTLSSEDRALMSEQLSRGAEELDGGLQFLEEAAAEDDTWQQTPPATDSGAVLGVLDEPLEYEPQDPSELVAPPSEIESSGNVEGYVAEAGEGMQSDKVGDPSANQLANNEGEPMSATDGQAQQTVNEAKLVESQQATSNDNSGMVAANNDGTSPNSANQSQQQIAGSQMEASANNETSASEANNRGGSNSGMVSTNSNNNVNGSAVDASSNPGNPEAANKGGSNMTQNQGQSATVQAADVENGNANIAAANAAASNSATANTTPAQSMAAGDTQTPMAAGSDAAKNSQASDFSSLPAKQQTEINRKTDEAFYAANPNMSGQKIDPASNPESAKEWMRTRENVMTSQGQTAQSAVTGNTQLQGDGGAASMISQTSSNSASDFTKLPVKQQTEINRKTDEAFYAANPGMAGQKIDPTTNPEAAKQWMGTRQNVMTNEVQNSTTGIDASSMRDTTIPSVATATKNSTISDNGETASVNSVTKSNQASATDTTYDKVSNGVGQSISSTPTNSPIQSQSQGTGMQNINTTASTTGSATLSSTNTNNTSAKPLYGSGSPVNIPLPKSTPDTSGGFLANNNTIYNTNLQSSPSVSNPGNLYRSSSNNSLTQSPPVQGNYINFENFNHLKRQYDEFKEINTEIYDVLKSGVGVIKEMSYYASGKAGQNLGTLKSKMDNLTRIRQFHEGLQDRFFHMLSSDFSTDAGQREAVRLSNETLYYAQTRSQENAEKAVTGADLLEKKREFNEAISKLRQRFKILIK